MGTKILVRAKQLLTMVSGVDARREPVAGMGATALRERDDRITGCLYDAAVAVADGRIAWVGPQAEIPKAFRGRGTINIDANVVTPGWVDCHTHAVFAGSRRDEFVLRNMGADYSQILEEGGGILASQKALNQVSTRALTAALVERCFEATRGGITTMEVKSGYGLSADGEIKQLRAIQNAMPEVLVDLQPTFLGAHAIPKKYRDSRDDYVNLVCETMIPQVAKQKLARYCDVFCDKGAFTPAEAERILLTGKEHGLIPRIHADELSPAGATEVAIAVEAASADHLEHVSDAAMAKMAEKEVTAVLLPAVNLFLDMPERAPARKLMEAGVEVALATDFNPGTAMSQDLGLVMTMANTLLKMTPGESLYGVTRAGASALALADIGKIEVGARADLTMLGVEDYWEVPYHFGKPHTQGVIQNGEVAYWCSAEQIEE